MYADVCMSTLVCENLYYTMGCECVCTYVCMREGTYIIEGEGGVGGVFVFCVF